MGCCTPNAVGAGPAAADPCKRVNYTLGMLLGVDDFVQEAEYHGARRRELARELIGYGTVHGLQVVVEVEDDRGPRVRIMPGMAWLPSGTPVCVDRPQCANLNDWLAAHQGEVGVASPDAALTLYVVLAHAQCLTDNVPIPGEPCRDDAELMQPSRITDSFRLELRLAPPPQREEEAIRDFVAWLLDVPLAASSPPLTEQEFVEQLRAAAHAWLAPTSPPASPSDYMLGSAPAGTSEDLLAAALRLWVTELRPLWMARADCGCNAEPIAPKDDAVLLAELAVPLVAGSPGWQVSDAPDAVRQDERRRPYVLSLRMLQELITLHPVPDPGDHVVSETAFGQARDAGVSLHYARADHTHGTPPLPQLGGDVGGAIGSNWIESLQGVQLVATSPLVDDHVLTVQGGQWVPKALPPPPPPAAPPPLGDDLSGVIAHARVEALQGVTLVTPSPVVDGHVLTLVGGQWMPQPVPTPTPTPPPVPQLAGDVGGLANSNEIGQLQGKKVDARAPRDKDVLRFRRATTTWVPEAIAYVGRGQKAEYEITAAAVVDVSVGNQQAVTVTVRRPYGDVTLLSAQAGGTQVNITLAVRGMSAVPRLTGHLVKLTPILRKYPFRAFLGGTERVGDTEMRVTVVLLADAALGDGGKDFPFQIEISRYEEP